MALLQSCVRCRSRRMKCDLRLPSCGTCVQLGAECCTTDPGLGENVPRGYIHTLQQQVERLEQQIKTRQLCIQGQPHHPPQRDRQLSQEYDYFGPGTSVDLFDRLCRLFELSSSAQYRMTPTRVGAKDLAVQPLPQISGINLTFILTPLLQKEMIAYFVETIGSALPSILSTDQMQMFLQEANPLSACDSNNNRLLRIILLSVLATSARLMSQERNAEYAYLDNICWSEAHKELKAFAEVSASDGNVLGQVRVICLQVVHQMVLPTQSRVYPNLLNTTQLLLATASCIASDDQAGLDAVAQLGLFLSQVEVMICSHFKRPSMQYQALRALSSHPATWLDVSMHVLQLFEGRRNVTEAEVTSTLSQFGLTPGSQEQLKPETALIYLSLHPIFTADITWLGAERPHAPCSPKLLLCVSQAARFYINYLSAQPSPAVICIWMTLERVLQAGFVWIIFMVYLLRTNRDIDVADVLWPLTQTDRVLSVLCERWKPGLPYYLTWNIIRYKALSLL